MVILAILGFLALMPLASIIRGYCLSILWFWFLCPLGVPEINIPLAIGISMIVGMLTYENPKKDKEDTAKTLIVQSLLLPIIILFFGWIVHLFL